MSVITAKAFAGDHLDGKGKAFTVYYLTGEALATRNAALGHPPPGHPARLKAGWYWQYEAPGAPAHGAYSSSRRAWDAARGLPAGRHARPGDRGSRKPATRNRTEETT